MSFYLSLFENKPIKFGAGKYNGVRVCGLGTNKGENVIWLMESSNKLIKQRPREEENEKAGN